VTSTTAFSAYLDALPQTILSPQFRERIGARERRNDYPFSVQNIYRVLFAAGPILRHGWLTLAQTKPLDPDASSLGTSLRCFRYLHALLLDDQPPQASAAAALEPIAARAMRVTDTPSCFCALPLGPGDDSRGRHVSVDLALRLAVSLRQYADVRWLGQHDQGFVGKPPTSAVNGELCYTRCFGRLPAVTRVPTLEITVAYSLIAAAEVVFDRFRGELTTPPRRSAARWAMVTVPETGEQLDDAAAAVLLQHITDALREAAANQPTDQAHGNIVVAEAFSFELCRVARQCEVDPDPWLTAILDRLPTAAPAAACLTDAYLDTLSRSIEQWRAVL
jgi:hypothetical protein